MILSLKLKRKILIVSIFKRENVVVTHGGLVAYHVHMLFYVFWVMERLFITIAILVSIRATFRALILMQFTSCQLLLVLVMYRTYKKFYLSSARHNLDVLKETRLRAPVQLQRRSRSVEGATVMGTIIKRHAPYLLYVQILLKYSIKTFMKYLEIQIVSIENFFAYVQFFNLYECYVGY